MGKTWIALAAAALVAGGASAAEMDAAAVEAALKRLAADYETDPMAIAGVYGVEVGPQVWTIDVRRPEATGPAKVSVTRGEPATPTFVYKTDPATFARIASGEVSAYTSMAKAFSSDFAPLDLRLTGGYKPDAAFAARFRSFSFHFFEAGKPEVPPMGVEHSRFTHGAQATIGYYAEGLRSAWLTVKPGQHANADPKSQTDPWTTLLFVVEGGDGVARIGGQEIALKDRTMIFVAPNTTHEFWNKGTRAAEMIMVVFGTGS